MMPYIINILSNQRIAPLPLHLFIDLDEEIMLSNRESLGFSSMMEPRRKKDKEDCNYLEEHKSFFEFFDMDWPPTYPEDLAVYRGLSRRQGESLYLLNQAFPADLDKPEFVNVNWSLCRHFALKRHIELETKNRKDLKYPWKPTIQTITAHSMLVLRFRTMREGREVFMLRQFEPYEYMRCIGWDIRDWKSGVNRSDNALAFYADLAGNAFSGFVVAPIIAGIVSYMGHIKVERPTLPIRATISVDDDDYDVIESCSPDWRSANDGDDIASLETDLGDIIEESQLIM